MTQQFTATGTFSDNSTQNLTSQVTWASATPASATITAGGLATGVAHGHVDHHARRWAAVTGSTVLTVTAAALQSIAVTPANPSDRQGEDPAVHGDRHLLRQLHAEPDQPGDVGVGRHPQSPRSRPAGWRRVWRRARRRITRDAGRRHGLDGPDGDRGGAAVDRGDAGQSERSPRGRLSSSRRRAPSPTTRRRT